MDLELTSFEAEHTYELAGGRHVRTPEGSRYFHLPIGAPITLHDRLVAKLRNGGHRPNVPNITRRGGAPVGRSGTPTARVPTTPIARPGAPGRVPNTPATPKADVPGAPPRPSFRPNAPAAVGKARAAGVNPELPNRTYETRPSELSGPNAITVGGRKYNVPRSAVVRRRPGNDKIAYVTTENGETYVLTREGEVLVPPDLKARIRAETRDIYANFEVERHKPDTRPTLVDAPRHVAGPAHRADPAGKERMPATATKVPEGGKAAAVRSAAVGDAIHIATPAGRGSDKETRRVTFVKLDDNAWEADPDGTGVPFVFSSDQVLETKGYAYHDPGFIDASGYQPQTAPEVLEEANTQTGDFLPHVGAADLPEARQGDVVLHADPKTGEVETFTRVADGWQRLSDGKVLSDAEVSALGDDLYHGDRPDNPPLTFSVGGRQFEVPDDGSKLFHYTGNDETAFLRAPDGSVRAFTKDGEVEAYSPLMQQAISNAIESNDGRFEQQSFDSLPDLQPRPTFDQLGDSAVLSDGETTLTRQEHGDWLDSRTGVPLSDDEVRGFYQAGALNERQPDEQPDAGPTGEPEPDAGTADWRGAFDSIFGGDPEPSGSGDRGIPGGVGRDAGGDVGRSGEAGGDAGTVLTPVGPSIGAASPRTQELVAQGKTVPTIHEVDPEQGRAVFAQRQTALASGFIGSTDPSALQDSRIYLTGSGNAGIAVKDGSLVGLFVAPGSSDAGSARALVAHAVDLGATRLDTTNPTVAFLLSREGFSVTARVPDDVEDSEISQPETLLLSYDPDTNTWGHFPSPVAIERGAELPGELVQGSTDGKALQRQHANERAERLDGADLASLPPGSQVRPIGATDTIYEVTGSGTLRSPGGTEVSFERAKATPFAVVRRAPTLDPIAVKDERYAAELAESRSRVAEAVQKLRSARTEEARRAAEAEKAAEDARLAEIQARATPTGVVPKGSASYADARAYVGKAISSEVFNLMPHPAVTVSITGKGGDTEYRLGSDGVTWEPTVKNYVPGRKNTSRVVIDRSQFTPSEDVAWLADRGLVRLTYAPPPEPLTSDEFRASLASATDNDSITQLLQNRFPERHFLGLADVDAKDAEHLASYRRFADAVEVMFTEYPFLHERGHVGFEHYGATKGDALPSSWYAMFSHQPKDWPRAYSHKVVPSLRYNLAWTPDKQDRGEALDVKHGFHPEVPGGAMLSTIAHEVGHALDYYLSENKTVDGGLIRKLSRGKGGLRGILAADGRLRTDGGKIYSQKSFAEAFAELFSEYFLNPKKGGLGADFGEALRKALQKRMGFTYVPPVWQSHSGLPDAPSDV